MKNKKTVEPYLPANKTISSLRAAAQHCKGCELYKNATQAVFGEGDQHPKIVLVGEQPGDKEDIEGKPFVGPAGKLLDRALAAAGIERGEVYVTNAVKHFRWEQKGERRLHKKPSMQQVAACHPWLEEELKILKPAVLICLGATATVAVFEKSSTIKSLRGKIHVTRFSAKTIVTVHPSSLLRAPDEKTRQEMLDEFVKDLKQAKKIS